MTTRSCGKLSTSSKPSLELPFVTTVAGKPVDDLLRIIHGENADDRRSGVIEEKWRGRVYAGNDRR